MIIVQTYKKSKRKQAILLLKYTRFQSGPGMCKQQPINVLQTINTSSMCLKP